MPNRNGEQGQRPILTIKEIGKRAARKAAEPLSPIAAEAVTPPTEDVNIRMVRSRIEEVFFALGTDQFPGTVLPAGTKNNASEAAEFVLADMLSKLATERLKKASEAAEKAGVFGDPEDYVIGDTVMVFSDPNFSINVKMGKASKMIDRKQVEEAAAKALGKKAQDFLSECMKMRAATKQIIVSMK